MDWDGIGTFALFIGSGAIGVGLIALSAFKAKLASKLEQARLERAADVPDGTQEQIRELEDEVRRLRDRVEFTERLLSGRTSAARPRDESADEV